VTGRAAGRPRLDDAGLASGTEARTRPRASITAEMPVTAERTTGQPLLDGAQPRLGEVLLGPRPAAEPGGRW
jgi:hypothetical protein